MKDIHQESIEINGQTLTLEVGRYAQQATSTVFARMGDTCVLVTATAGRTRDDLDFFPLQVEYVEKLYAGGRIKGSRWVKREGKPTDDAILKARIIDRSIRPLFPKGYKRDVQVIVTLMSVDGVNPPDMLGTIATYAALHISSIPWDGPISTIRMGYVEADGTGDFVINPVESEDAYSQLDLIVTSSRDKVLMLETQAQEISEERALEGITRAKEVNNQIIDLIERLRKKVGVEKEKFEGSVVNEEMFAYIKDTFYDEVKTFTKQNALKESGDKDALNTLVTKIAESKEDEELDTKEIAKCVDYLSKQIVRDLILDTKERLDGRGPDDIRALSAEISLLPRTHGTGLFQRGDTQALSIATLGAPSLSQLIESPEGETAKHYMHHYYMPPYSVGETGRVGFPSRREIGHGALAEKAIEPVLPSEKDFPYSIRVVSEVLSSNGSTSMASTCGSSLALMDAGVPIKKHVAGIAIGILTRSDDDYIILTDIMGVEDFSGEMDFKVAGTEDGITAIQLDVKNKGLTEKMIAEVFEKAKTARLAILEVMNKAIKAHRTEVSEFAPKIVVLYPPQEKIGEIIGPGGRNIRALIAKTQTQIDIDDDGKVTITGIKKDHVDAAVQAIENITKEIEPGEKFYGKVTRLLPFGAFVEMLPGREGLVHVSKMGKGFVKKPEDVVAIGDEVMVEVMQIDDQGRYNLRLLQAAK